MFPHQKNSSRMRTPLRRVRVEQTSGVKRKNSVTDGRPTRRPALHFNRPRRRRHAAGSGGARAGAARRRRGRRRRASARRGAAALWRGRAAGRAARRWLGADAALGAHGDRQSELRRVRRQLRRDEANAAWLRDHRAAASAARRRRRGVGDLRVRGAAKREQGSEAGAARAQGARLPRARPPRLLGRRVGAGEDLLPARSSTYRTPPPPPPGRS